MESLAGVAAIRAQLAADSTLVAGLDTTSLGVVKIRHKRADPTWPPHWIVLKVRSSPGPSRIPGGDIVWSPLVITTDLVTQGLGDEDIQGLVGRICARLDRQLFPAPEGGVELCLRGPDRPYDEDTDGKTYTHTQIDWKLLITPASSAP